MTPSPSPVAAVLAELRRHDIGAFNGSQVGCTCDRTWRTTDEWRKHVAADIAEVLALPRLLAAIRAVDELAGYDGLGMGIEQILGGEPVWFSDNDPGASKILAHRYPTVPNLGDITKVDWASVEPVEILTGGFPCQDVSAAGKRLGMKPGTRSGLWSHMAYAINQLRPSLVVAENVRGLLSASAHSDLEPCPWCVGDGGDVALRALGGVLGDLADLGYDASWQGLRASDVGAPHGRFRVFVIAWPAEDTHVAAGRERRVAAPGQAEGGRARSDTGRRGGASAADAYAGGRRPELAELRAREPDAGRRATSDTHGGQRAGREREPQRLSVVGATTAGPRSGARRGEASSDPDGDGLALIGGQQPVECDADGRSSAHLAWGSYEPAIRRWEQLTRRSPAPTEPGKTGARLSPAFVEWLMGLPAGHVTQVPGLTRNEQLKALGNGVVPQQAAEALRLLLPDALQAAS